MAMGSSLDQIGPVTRTVTDAETIFKAIYGQDRFDSTSIKYVLNDLPKGTKLKIGVPREFLKSEGIDPIVLTNFNESVEKFKALGYEVKDVNMPSLPFALAVYYILMPAEVSSNLARFDGIKYGLHLPGKNIIDDYFVTRRAGFGKEVRRRILLGTYVLSAGYYDAYYNKANIVRNVITKEYEEIFKEVDFILTPTSPMPAYKIGEKSSNPLEMYLADIFTVPVNIAGVPGLSIPSGFKEIEGKKLPLGIQLVSAHKREDILFRAGKDFLGEE
jgi:aspartyl-tRNA(Asn)/glutamyl-tRNA(Gln) amidotransferase subunit A